MINDCYKQLNINGLMVFVTISKRDFRFKNGIEISKDTFEPWPGLSLYFYDSDSIANDFANYNLIEAKEISEPIKDIGIKPTQKFWFIVCQK